MKIKEYRKHFLDELSPLYDAMEAESFFAIVLEEYHSMKRIDLALAPESEFTPEDLVRWDNILLKLKKEIPIQYIIGSTFFYGCKLEVNENVLIPRPETEELVQGILTDDKLIAKSHSDKTDILDIGTGSGCIAIALAKNFGNVKVTALDISTEALETAKRNAQSNYAEIEFIHADILKTDKLSGFFDLIVSNPPYVRMLEKNEMKSNVLDYEPHLALFVENDDALLFYRKIAALATDSLKKGGWLYFEINQYLAEEMDELLRNLGFVNIELKKDIYGNSRMIRCQKL